MQQHGRIGEDIRQNVQMSCSQYVLDHRRNIPAVCVSESKVKALAADDVNIQAILCGSPTMQDSNMLSDKVIQALVSFSWYRCINAKPNIEVAKRAVSMAKAFGNKTYIASSLWNLWCLGETYCYLGEYHAGYDHLQEAYHLYNALLPGDRELQKLCCQCGIDMVDAACVIFKDGDKMVTLARDVAKQAATVSDDHIHAESLMMLGKVMVDFGNRREALRHLEHANLKQMGVVSLSSSIFYWIALAHYHENRLPEALDAAEEAWKLIEPDNDIVDYAQYSFLLGRILFSANRDMEAWKYIEISLTMNLELGNRRDSARTLEYMGYGYLRKGDYLNAYGAYEAAAEHFLGTVLEKQGCTRCKDNMAKIKDMQRNPDLNVGFERPGADVDWPALFYPGAAASV